MIQGVHENYRRKRFPNAEMENLYAVIDAQAAALRWCVYRLNTELLAQEGMGKYPAEYNNVRALAFGHQENV